ncbi:MAG: hypothetical protein LBU39_03270 [Desulfobulbaceae bacterium]|jgi:ribosomal protein S12 methylthiotransferase|nr:hypothetical protein [Desulfobulbaceae bacterium]
MNTVHLVSLGCAKNLVDSQYVLGALQTAGFQLVDDATAADILLLNTCGFLQAAVEEGIDEILRLASCKGRSEQKLVVFGAWLNAIASNFCGNCRRLIFFLVSMRSSQLSPRYAI